MSRSTLPPEIVILLLTLTLSAAVALADDNGRPAGEGTGAEAFRQLGHLLPTPGDTRTASGAPGPEYWQQRVDYAISVELDDENQRIRGSEEITYHNLSPHSLRYLWVQLDQNRFRPDSDEMLTARLPHPKGLENFPIRTMTDWLARHEFPGGYDIRQVSGAGGEALDVAVVKTMMRVELPESLPPGESFRLRIDWEHNILDAVAIRARGGWEFFERDGNYIYEIAQWYPRLAAYTDYQGWQHKQFLGRGEFTLELGDYRVEITVPDDHVVGATGVLQNTDEVLTAAQRERFDQAATADRPVFIVTPEEATRNESTRPSGTKTWIFEAEDVRDFAFTTSRKFIWDAQGHEVAGGRRVMAMSFYPNEAEPLWSRYSTHAVLHTLNVYSSFTFEYPYPVAISVNGPIGGMEYPMISFNKPRPYDDGTYWDQRQKGDDRTWERSKYGLVSVIIHEVGHNYFPMVVNSDERQWTWMDEGLNSFLQYLSEQEWEDGYPSRRGEPREIVSYMTSGNVVPIMTNSESLLQFSPNAYGKPATALNILRESILGRELFDYAFKEYARRWKFKRPTPADFFRTMEDASGVDLDWFWRGWFYGTDYVDISIEKLSRYELDTKNPDVEKPRLRKMDEEEPESLSQQRNREIPKRIDEHSELEDFYNSFDEFDVTPWDYAQYEKFLETLDEKEKAVVETDKLFFVADFVNIGGLPMPLPLEITYADASVEEVTIPAEIWRYNAHRVSKLFITEKEIVKIAVDPHLETADADLSNNHYPREIAKSRFQLFKRKEDPNPMRRGEKGDGKD